MRLDTLPAESAGELLEALLGEDPGLEPLKQLLVRRGNPFFLEETVRTLVETKALAGECGGYRLTQPVQAIQVPPTVQAMLAARIDRLAAEDKRLLQTASVVGKDVPFALLQAIAELPDDALRSRLDRLRAADFLYETGLFPDLEYIFKHALTHDVTYGSLLQERRGILHGELVGAIERLHRDRLGEQIEGLAHHAVRGALGEKAVSYLRQAGNKAAARSALADARVWFDQAIDTLTGLPERQTVLEAAFEVRLDLRAVLTQLGEAHQSLEVLQEAERLAERLGDGRRQSRVCGVLANTHTLLGNVEEALVAATRAWTIAEAGEDMEAQILSRMCLQQAHQFHGDFDRVVELAGQNLAAVPAQRAHEFFGSLAPASIYNRYWMTLALTQLGRFDEATQHVWEALRLAEPTRHAYSLGAVHLAAGVLHLWKGEWAAAYDRLETGISVFRAANITILVPRMVASTAWALAHLGESRKALSRVSEARQLLDGLVGRGTSGMLPHPSLATAGACFLLARLDEARELAQRALGSARSQPASSADALHLLGDIATYADPPDIEQGEAYYHAALALAEPRGMRPLVAHCHLGLGKLHCRTGKREEAQEHLATATTMYREMGMTYWLERAEAEVTNLGR